MNKFLLFSIISSIIAIIYGLLLAKSILKRDAGNEKMKAIADITHKRLSKEERHMILKYITENIDESSQNFDLRIQGKTENLYLYSKEKWKELSETNLNTKNKKMVLIKEFIRSSKTLKEAKKKWTKSTGLTNRQFNRYQSKIKGDAKTLH